MISYVYIEPSEEFGSSLTRQILERLARVPESSRGPLVAITTEQGLEARATPLFGLLDELVLIETPSGYAQNTEALSNMLADILTERGGGLLFLGFTHQGMELGPVVGWRLEVPVLTSCTEFAFDKGTLKVERPILGGKFKVSCSVDITKGAVISVQKGMAADDEELPANRHKAPEVTRLPWRETWNPVKSEILEISEEELQGEEDITKASILVSVGRGLGDPENLAIVEELAESLGGTISCSRPVVDLRWLPASRQVGISGKTVNPSIYLALGISGQTNHVAGMDASKTIIAINKDPSAPIFDVAHYGVVDNLLEFVPEIIGQLKKKGADQKPS